MDTTAWGSDIVPVVWSVLAGGPVLLAHVFAAGSVVLLGLTGYVHATPHHEIRLIRDGNAAAGMALAATIIGVVLPGAVCLQTGVTFMDVVIWTILAVVLQLLVFRAVDMIFKDLAERIENGEMGAAAVLSAGKIGTGILIAAGLA